MPIEPQRRGALASTTVDDIEESLLRTMEDDPRLASGAALPRADNVLDFIQMTGLTTGRVPAASAPPAEHADDPISFFELGVRDVDGTGDPIETAYPDLDADAFHIDMREIVPAESKSVADLKQIIAELAAMQTDDVPETRSVVEAPNSSETPRAAAASPATELRTIKADDVPGLEADQPTAELPEPAIDDVPTPVIEEPSHYESPMKSPAGLAAARELLEELAHANQAAERAQHAFARSIPQPPVRLTPQDPVHPEADASPAPQDDDAGEQTTHHGLVKRRREPSLRRMAAWLGIVLAAGGAGWSGFLFYERAARPPRAAFEAAQSLIDKGRYEDASAAFLDFTTRFEGNPRRADALYMAGYALQLVPEVPPARAKEAYTEAIELLRRFIEEYPTHEKTPRAETLMGVSYYRTGRYLEAINILGAPDLRYRDQGGYLTALRTLGRAYAAIGQPDNARSAFMRAAALENNMQPDQDYAELAGMYTQLAERSGDPAQRRRYFQLAVEQWDFALQVPGLLRSRRDDMKLLRDAAAEKAENEFGALAQGEPPTARVQATPGSEADRIEVNGGAAAPVQ